ncbi:hypothetical protein [Embleya sp. NBC_00896]|uniref:hypothetical protein n=1 Tax=Embleya sp. NBC_00896 TaxID=2975961 RepID=UPI003865E5D9|nr:hypothetical protein OG928_13435 [Embleya sp. NBC_00896]
MSGVGTPGNDGQGPWSVRPGAPGTPGQARNPYDPFPSHAHDPHQQPQPQQPFAPNPQPQQPAQQPFGPAGGGPDWSALAEQRDAAARRRKLMFTAGGAALALALVGGIVAAAVTMSGGDGDTTATPGASGSASTAPFSPGKPSFRPAPTVPPPPAAQNVLADPALDTAPFSVESLFPNTKFTVDGRAYNVVAAKLDNTCSDGTDPKLGPALRNQQCTQLIRLAVTGPDGVVSTAAVASFPSADKADAIKNGKDGGELLALAGPGVKVLDAKKQKHGKQRNSIGRYALLTIDWYADGKDPVGQDQAIGRVEDDLNRFLWNAMTARGEAMSKQIDDENRRKALEQVQG